MPETAYEITVPQESVNDESVRIVSWSSASGTPVAKDQLLCEIETSKAVMEIHAPVDGMLDYHFLVGEEVQVGTTICTIMPKGAAKAVSGNGNVAGLNGSAMLTAAKEIEPVRTQPVDLAGVDLAGADLANIDLPVARLTPLARKLAAEYKIDIACFPNGSLVRKNDILRKAGVAVTETPKPKWLDSEKPQRSQSSQPEQTVAAPVMGVAIEWRDLARRKTIEGKVLAAGRAATVQSSLTASVRSSGLAERAKHLLGSNLGKDALILFEVARLLLKFPMFNAIHDRGRIGQYGEVNVGWALDGGYGLVVPVVKGGDKKTMGEIASTMERQLEAYLENALPMDDLKGGTFTISNLSNDGISFFQPLISQGQSAILGIGADIRSRNSSQQEELLYLTLAFDHQVAEGRVAAQFLRELSERIEAHSPLQPEIHESAQQAGGSQIQRSQTPAEELYCVMCQRDYATLQRYKAVLLKSEVPQGLVCSFCVSGL